MTVKELIEELEKYPANTPVVMSKDAEGNGYSPARVVDLVHYETKNTWRGEIYDEKDAPEGAVPAVCLWPAN
jgi:hypothetical protein